MTYKDRAVNASYMREYRKTHPEQERERDRLRYQNDSKQRERYKTQSYLWQRANAGVANQHKGEWKVRNPDAMQAINLRRRTRQRDTGGYVSGKDIKALKELGNHCCYACLQPSPRLQVDHIIPVALGGSSDVQNLQMLCGKCNRAKSTKIIDYRSNLPLLWVA